MSLLILRGRRQHVGVKKSANGKKSPITVRLDPDDIKGLAEMREGTQLDESCLVRGALKAAVAYYRKHGNISFPVRLIPEDVYKRVIACADTIPEKQAKLEAAYSKAKKHTDRPY